MNFSFALIVRNEEKTLPRLLGSLTEFRDRGGKVVVLDTGSTDQTVKVAHDWGCQVHEVGNMFKRFIDLETADKINKEFCIDEKNIVEEGDSLFDYASARNYVSEFAPTDFIFTPDADEIWTQFDIDAVTKAIETGVEQLEYNFVFSHDEFGNEAIKFMHCKAYDRRKLSWRGIVHEVLLGDARRQFFGEDVLKLEHYQNEETNRSGYLRGLALDCYENPTNDRNAHYLGRELLWTGRPHSAIKQLERHLEISTWKAERSQSMIFMGDAYKILGDEQNAIMWWNLAFLEDSNRRESLIKLAEHFKDKSDFQKAVCYASAALQIPKGNFYADNQEHYTTKPHEILYLCYWYLGRREESRVEFDKAFSQSPLKSSYLHDYCFYYELPKVSILFPILGRPEGTAKALKAIENLNYPKEKIELVTEEDINHIGVPKMIENLYAKSTGDAICYLANDTEITPDALILAVIKSKDYGLVAFNTGELYEDNGNVCEHFIITRNMISEIGGQIFDTDFHHAGVDNLLWLKCGDKAIRCKEATVAHNHFSRGAPMDEVYELAYSKVEEDRELLKTKCLQYQHQK